MSIYTLKKQKLKNKYIIPQGRCAIPLNVPKLGVSSVKDTAKTNQKNTIFFYFSILKIFFTWLQESYQWKKTPCFNCKQHDMPKSLLVFAVSLTPETPNFETFGGVMQPILRIFFIIFAF